MATADLEVSSSDKDEAHESNEHFLNGHRSIPADTARDPNEASIALKLESAPLSLECELTSSSSKWSRRHNVSGGSPASVLQCACTLAKVGAVARWRAMYAFAFALYIAYFATAMYIAVFLRSAKEPDFCVWNDEPTIRLIRALCLHFII